MSAMGRKRTLTPLAEKLICAAQKLSAEPLRGGNPIANLDYSGRHSDAAQCLRRVCRKLGDHASIAARIDDQNSPDSQLDFPLARALRLISGLRQLTSQRAE